MPLDDRAGAGRRNLDRGLVGLHLHERLILVHRGALGDEQAQNLALVNAFAEIGKPELTIHDVSPSGGAVSR
ncbi:MAG: hypothetical protein KF817_00595 [Phycisphaeraceae bacterium]|nr:hypothetical protein [Phycisphaeraceae bacterium]